MCGIVRYTLHMLHSLAEYLVVYGIARNNNSIITTIMAHGTQRGNNVIKNWIIEHDCRYAAFVVQMFSFKDICAHRNQRLKFAHFWPTFGSSERKNTTLNRNFGSYEIIMFSFFFNLSMFSYDFLHISSWNGPVPMSVPLFGPIIWSKLLYGPICQSKQKINIFMFTSTLEHWDPRPAPRMWFDKQWKKIHVRSNLINIRISDLLERKSDPLKWF